MSSRVISSESKKHRKAAADHLRKSRKVNTSTEKASEMRIAKSYKTMATNQDWLDTERVNAASRKPTARNQPS
jgi:hypothetical protein